MNVKKMLRMALAAMLVCCWMFAGTASAQDDDIWGDYSTPTEISIPEPESSSGSSSASPGWEPMSDLEEPAVKNTPEKAKKEPKPEKAPKVKAEKTPKPAKEPKAASADDERTLNIFANLGYGFGIGAYLLREVNVIDDGGDVNKDYHMNMADGLKFEIGAGYMAAPNLEARFSVDFNFGLFTPKFENTVTPSIGTTTTEYVVDYSYWSWGVRAMAVPAFEMLELLDMYAGAGLSLNFAYGKVDSTTTVNDGDPNTNTNDAWDMRFSPALGFCGVIGFVLPVSEVMDFVGELQFESKSFNLKTLYRKTGEISYKQDSPNHGDAPPKYSGSNWGIRAGIRYWIPL